MITKVDWNDIPGRATSYNNMVTADIREFMESEWTVCEVSVDKYKTVQSAACAYKNAINRMGAKAVTLTRGGRLFLMKKEK